MLTSVIEYLLLSSHFPHTPFLRFLCTSTSSSSAAVNFLVASCGLSLPAALSTAQNLRLSEPSSLSNPQAVISLLKSHGFSPSQLSTLISVRPSFLLSNPDRTLAPKLQYLFTSSGIPRSHIPDLIASTPVILTRSLDNHIKPTFDLLHSFVSSPEDILLTLRRNRWFLCFNLRRTIGPNISLLIDRGVPTAHVGKLLTTHPRSLMMRSDLFAEAVETAESFGIRPEMSLFVHAVRAMTGMSKATRVGRMDFLKSFGWSEGEICAAFRRAPLFVLVSEEKLRRSMDFFVNKVGLELPDLSLCPKLLMYGLEKRMFPRYEFFRALESRGVVILKGKTRRKKVIRMLTCTEKDFLHLYVRKYSAVTDGC